MDDRCICARNRDTRLPQVGGRLPSLTPPRAWQIAPPDLVGAEHRLRYIAHCHGDDALTAVLASKRCLEL